MVGVAQQIQSGCEALRKNRKDFKACKKLCAALSPINDGVLQAIRQQAQLLFATLCETLAEYSRITPLPMEPLLDMSRVLLAIVQKEASSKPLLVKNALSAVMMAIVSTIATMPPASPTPEILALENVCADLLAAISTEHGSQAVFGSPGNQFVDMILKRMELAAPNERMLPILDSYCSALATFIGYGLVQKQLLTVCEGQFLARILTILESAPRVMTKISLLKILTATLKATPGQPHQPPAEKLTPEELGTLHSTLYNEGSIGLTIDILSDAVRCFASKIPNAELLMRTAAEFLASWPSDASAFARNVRRNLVDEGGVKASIEAIKTVSHEGPVVALLCKMLSNVCTEGSEDNVPVLLDVGVLDAIKLILKAHMEPPNEEALTASVSLLGVLARVGVSHSHIRTAGMVTAMYDVMEKTIPLHVFQSKCLAALGTLWAGHLDPLKQEIVDEGGMNLAVSFFSSAIDRVDLLLAGFPLLKGMIKHAIGDPSPDPPLSDTEVQVLVALLAYHPNNLSVLQNGLDVFLLLADDKKGNRADVINQKTIETLERIVSSPSFAEANLAIVAPLVLQLYVKLMSESTTSKLCVVHGITGSVAFLLGWALRSGSATDVTTAIGLLDQVGKLTPDIGPSCAAFLLQFLGNNTFLAKLAPNDIDALWQLLSASHHTKGSTHAFLFKNVIDLSRAAMLTLRFTISKIESGGGGGTSALPGQTHVGLILRLLVAFLDDPSTSAQCTPGMVSVIVSHGIRPLQRLFATPELWPTSPLPVDLRRIASRLLKMVIESVMATPVTLATNTAFERWAESIPGLYAVLNDPKSDVPVATDVYFVLIALANVGSSSVQVCKTLASIKVEPLFLTLPPIPVALKATFAAALALNVETIMAAISAEKFIREAVIAASQDATLTIWQREICRKAAATIQVQQPTTAPAPTPASPPAPAIPPTPASPPPAAPTPTPVAPTPASDAAARKPSLPNVPPPPQPSTGVPTGGPAPPMPAEPAGAEEDAAPAAAATGTGKKKKKSKSAAKRASVAGADSTTAPPAPPDRESSSSSFDSAKSASPLPQPPPQTVAPSLTPAAPLAPLNKQPLGPASTFQPTPLPPPPQPFSRTHVPLIVTAMVGAAAVTAMGLSGRSTHRALAPNQSLKALLNNRPDSGGTQSTSSGSSGAAVFGSASMRSTSVRPSGSAGQREVREGREEWESTFATPPKASGPSKQLADAQMQTTVSLVKLQTGVSETQTEPQGEDPKVTEAVQEAQKAKKEVAELNTKLADALKTIETLQKQNAENAQRSSAVAGDAQAHLEEANKLRQQLTDQTTRTATITNELDASQKECLRVSDQLKELETKTKELEASLSAERTRVGEVTVALQALEEKEKQRAAIEHSLAESQTDISAVNKSGSQSLDALCPRCSAGVETEKELKKLLESVELTSRNLVEREEHVNRLEQELPLQHDKLRKREVDLTVQESNLKGAQADFAARESTLAAAEASLKALQEQVESKEKDLDDQRQNLRSRLEALLSERETVVSTREQKCAELERAAAEATRDASEKTAAAALAVQQSQDEWVRIGQWEEQHGSLEDRAAQLDAKQAQLLSKSEHLAEELARYEVDSKTLKALQAEMEGKRQTLEKEIATRTAEMNDRDQALNQRQEALDNREANLVSREEVVASAQAKIDGDQRKATEALTAAEAQRQRTRDLLNEFETKGAALVDRELKCECLESQLKQREQQVDRDQRSLTRQQETFQVEINETHRIRTETEERQRKLATREKDLELLRAQLETTKVKHLDREIELNAKDAVQQATAQTLASRESAVRAQETALGAKTEELKTRETTLAQRETKVLASLEEKENELASAIAKVEVREGLVAAATQRLVEGQTAISAREAEVLRREAQLAELETECARLQEELRNEAAALQRQGNELRLREITLNNEQETTQLMSTQLDTRTNELARQEADLVRRELRSQQQATRRASASASRSLRTSKPNLFEPTATGGLSSEDDGGECADENGRPHTVGGYMPKGGAGDGQHVVEPGTLALHLRHGDRSQISASQHSRKKTGQRTGQLRNAHKYHPMESDPKDSAIVDLENEVERQSGLLSKVLAQYYSDKREPATPVVPYDEVTNTRLRQILAEDSKCQVDIAFLQLLRDFPIRHELHIIPGDDLSSHLYNWYSDVVSYIGSKHQFLLLERLRLMSQASVMLGHGPLATTENVSQLPPGASPKSSSPNKKQPMSSPSRGVNGGRPMTVAAATRSSSSHSSVSSGGGGGVYRNTMVGPRPLLLHQATDWNAPTHGKPNPSNELSGVYKPGTAPSGPQKRSSSKMAL